MDAQLALESALVEGELVGRQDGPEGQDLLPLLLVHAGWPMVINAYANVVMVFQMLKCQRQVNFWARLSNRKVRSLFARRRFHHGAGASSLLAQVLCRVARCCAALRAGT